MRNLRIICSAIFVASLVIPAVALAQPQLTEVVFARDVVGSEPAMPFDPGAYCEKGSQPSGPVPTINSETEPKVVFWNRIESDTEGTIRHTWYKDGVKMADVELKVGVSPRWRTWSSKRIVPRAHAGKWQVEVSTTGAQAEILCVAHFTVE